MVNSFEFPKFKEKEFINCKNCGAPILKKRSREPCPSCDKNPLKKLTDKPEDLLSLIFKDKIENKTEDKK